MIQLRFYKQTIVLGNNANAHQLTRDGVQSVMLYKNSYGIKDNAEQLERLIGRK
jgi:hypothetical protein